MKRIVTLHAPGVQNERLHLSLDLSRISDQQRGHMLRIARLGEHERSVFDVLRGNGVIPNDADLSIYGVRGDMVTMRPVRYSELTPEERAVLQGRSSEAYGVLIDADEQRFLAAMRQFEERAIVGLRQWDGRNPTIPVWLHYRRFGSDVFAEEVRAFTDRYCARFHDPLFDEANGIQNMTQRATPEMNDLARQIALRFGGRITRESTGAVFGRWSDDRGRNVHWSVVDDSLCTAEFLFGTRRIAYVEVENGKATLRPKRSEIDPFFIDVVDSFIEAACGDDYGPLFQGEP